MGNYLMLSSYNSDKNAYFHILNTPTIIYIKFNNIDKNLLADINFIAFAESLGVSTAYFNLGNFYMIFTQYNRVKSNILNNVISYISYKLSNLLSLHLSKQQLDELIPEIECIKYNSLHDAQIGLYKILLNNKFQGQIHNFHLPEIPEEV